MTGLAQMLVEGREARLAVFAAVAVLLLVAAGTVLWYRVRRQGDEHEAPDVQEHRSAPAVEHPDEAQLVADYAEGKFDEEEFRRRLEGLRRRRPTTNGDHGGGRYRRLEDT